MTPSWATLASSAFSRFFMFSRSWRCHTQRTPKGEMSRPHWRSSLATRAWPQVGCSTAISTTGLLDLGLDAVLQDRLAAADLLQGEFATGFVELFKPVEAVAR